MKYFLTVYKVYAHITAQKIKTSPFFGSFVPACQANEGSWLNHRGNWQFPWQVDLLLHEQEGYSVSIFHQSLNFLANSSRHAHLGTAADRTGCPVVAPVTCLSSSCRPVETDFDLGRR